MIILVIKNVNISFAELKSNSPIAIYADRPAPLFLTKKSMQTKSRNIQIVDNLSRIKRGKLKAQPFCMDRLHARNASRFKQLCKSFVLERFNHTAMITRCCVLRNKNLPNV